MSEKDLIESETIKHFLKLYNEQYNLSYRIIKHDDAPDFICANLNNEILNIEVTLTQDRDKDIQALLGRSEHKSINFIKENIKKVKNGEMTHLAAVTTFDNDTLPMLYKSIEGKMQKDYGKSVMLVIRDTSPLDWDYTPYLEDIRETIDKSFSTHHKVFEKGIWLLNSTLNKIYKLT